jgi:hypothetical protein
MPEPYLLLTGLALCPETRPRCCRAVKQYSIYSGVDASPAGGQYPIVDGQWSQLMVSGPTASQGQEAMMAHDPMIKAALLAGSGRAGGVQSTAEWLLSRS